MAANSRYVSISLTNRRTGDPKKYASYGFSYSSPFEHFIQQNADRNILSRLDRASIFSSSLPEPATVSAHKRPDKYDYTPLQPHVKFHFLSKLYRFLSNKTNCTFSGSRGAGCTVFMLPLRSRIIWPQRNFRSRFPRFNDTLNQTLANSHICAHSVNSPRPFLIHRFL